MANVTLDEDRKPPLVHNAYCFPELITFGPEMIREVPKLLWSISVVMDADRVPPYHYWIVNDKLKNSNAGNMLEAGDWIISISGASTSDKDNTFIETVKHKCHNDILILVIRKPVEYQEFNLWDPNPVTINIKAGLNELPFSLDIFYPDLNDNSKTYALVDKILQQKIDLKGLKRGDKVIAINEHILQDKTHKELQHIVHRLHLQQQITLTIERRQWRQYGYLTRCAIDSPACVAWRGLQAELKIIKSNNNSKINPGFLFAFVENQLEQPCIIITHILAGHTPAATCPYLNPGCKITAINGQAVKGLTFHEVKTKLERAKTSVVLSIEEPICLLLEGSSLPSSHSTWPLETENGYLHKSLSEEQIRYAYSFQADNNLQRTDLTCQQKQATSNVVCDAKPTPLSVCESLPPASDYNTGFIHGASSSSGCSSIHQEPGTPLLPSEPHETPTDQDMPVCQSSSTTLTTPDKRKQTIKHIPGKIYNSMCSELDIKSCFYNDYRCLGEKLKFLPQEISKLSSSNEPTNDLLRAWITRKGDGATVGELLDALLEMERHDLWQLLQSWAENSTN